ILFEPILTICAILHLFLRRPPSVVVDLSPITYSSDLEDAFTSGNAEADHLLEKLPEKYTNVDSLASLTGSDAEIATLEGLGTPQIGNAKSVESDLVRKSSFITEGQVFDENSHTTVSSSIPELNYRFCKDISMQTKFLTSVLTDMKESNSVEEKKSLDNAALFNQSPQRDASGTLAPFTKQVPVLSNTHIQITEIVYPITTWVSLLIPLVGREDMMLNEHLEQDMATRYVVINSLGNDPPKWKTDLGTFTVVGLYVWDPGIGFGFMALTSYKENMEELLLLGCNDMFFLIVYSNSMSRVWDPGQLGCVKSNWFKVFSIVDICNVLTCPLIAYSLVFTEYYVVKHDILVANFQQTSVLHLRCIIALVGMVQFFWTLFDPINFLGEILSIPLSGSTTNILVNHGNISFDKKGTDGKEEWNEIKDIATSIWHLCELLLPNMTKFPYVATNSASTSLDDIIKCIALLGKSHISIHFCHVYQQLSNNETTMSIVLQVANEVASLLLTNLTIRGMLMPTRAKVLIGVGSIVMNGPRQVLAKRPNTELSGYVLDLG
ncbi:hypothetical protein H5410_002680, partial [Solanum commersonii]